MLRSVPKAKPEIEEAAVEQYRCVLETSGNEAHQNALLSILMQGRPMEGVVRSHWLAYPTLKAAAVKLMSFIGHQWRLNEEAPPLIVACIEEATMEAVRLVQEDGAKANHVVAAYISAMADCALIMCSYVTTANRGQVKVRWAPLESPLIEWASRNTSMEIRIEVGQKPIDTHQDGIKSQLLTRIASPTEVGMIMRNYF